MAVLEHAAQILFFYLSTCVAVQLFRRKAKTKQKLLFSLLVSICLRLAWGFGVHALNGLGDILDFRRVLILMAIPLPIAISILYNAFLVRKLHVPKAGAMAAAPTIYSLIVLSMVINHVIGLLFFQQPDPGRHNYMIDALSLAACTVINLKIYALVRYFLKKHESHIHFAENGTTFSVRGRLMISCIQMTVFFLFPIFTFLFLGNRPITSLVVAWILALSIFCMLLLEHWAFTRNAISGKDVYISSLLGSLEEFRGIKHDFYNILHTYSGYISLSRMDKLRQYHHSLMASTVGAGNKMELSKLMQRHPTLVGLLREKMAYAQGLGITIQMSLQCGLEDVILSEEDLQSLLTTAFDLAIDDAVQTNERSIAFAVRQKTCSLKRLMFNVSTVFEDGSEGAKEESEADRILRQREIIQKYARCAFRFSIYNHALITRYDLAVGE